MLTTEAFRAAVMHRTPPVREGVFESIVHLREVSGGDALIVDRTRRAARDVRFAYMVGQLNEVGLGLPFEDTSIRRVIDTDSDEWSSPQPRGGRGVTGVGALLQIFFTDPEEYVDDAGKFLSDLKDKSLEFRRGRLGGFVFARFRTVGDHGHRKPGSRLRRWQDELRHSDQGDDA